MNDHKPGGEVIGTANQSYNQQTRRSTATKAIHANVAQRFSRDRSDSSKDRIDSDSGANKDGAREIMAYRTYTNNEYGYRVTYPAEWTVEEETPGGVSFDARVGSAEAVVYVDEGLDCILGEYVAAFTDDLSADEYIRAIETLDRRDIALESGETGRVVECAYRNKMYDERWRLTYLFVLDGTTGYTLGVDWNADDQLEAIAIRIIESFALGSV